MNPLKVVAGIALIIAGVVLGIWLGLVVMFVGGIVQIVDAVKSDPVSGGDIAWGIVRLMFASVVGTIAFWMCAGAGAGLLTSAEKSKRFRGRRR